MGSSASKASRTAANAAANSVRKYPSRSSQAVSKPSAAPPRQAPTSPDGTGAGPKVHPPPQASGTRDEAINLDAQDPVFAAQLRQMGAVDAHPHFSNSSISPFDPHPGVESQAPQVPNARSNPALQILAARQKLQEEADEEFENVAKRGHEQRRFINVKILRQALLLRDQKGMSSDAIEKQLGLEKGSMAKLGGKGLTQAI